MPRKRKIILILVTLFLVITILRETGNLNLRLYNSNLTSSTTSHLSDYTGIAKVSKETLKVWPCITDKGLKGIPLLIYCLGYKYGEQGTEDCRPVAVFIDHIDHGPLWIPLYKSVRFNCIVPVTHALAAYRKDGDSIQLYSYQLSGIITLDGELTVTGICSRREAERLIADNVMTRVYNTMRARLDGMK